MPEALRLEQIQFGYGQVTVLHQINLTVPQGALVTLLGLSGSGKTTLLRLVGGYLRPSLGTIHLRDRDITHLLPERRNIGMVFQQYALFPHMTVRGNVGFGLEVRGIPRLERQRRVDLILERVGLGGNLHQRYPAQLSGGQQQRVALARALVIEPDLLLLDEPFANLDRALRDQLRTELRHLQQKTCVTTFLVTHDQEEALSISDIVAVLAEGKLVQVGTPRELYEQPKTPFLARFVGDANLFRVREVNGDRTVLEEGITLPSLPTHPGQWVLIRPEKWVCGADAEGLACRWLGRIIAHDYNGADQVLRIGIPRNDFDTPLVVRVRQRAGRIVPAIGDWIPFGFPLEATWLVPEDSHE